MTIERVLTDEEKAIVDSFVRILTDAELASLNDAFPQVTGREPTRFRDAIFAERSRRRAR